MKGRNNQRTFKNRTKIRSNDLQLFYNKEDSFDLNQKYLDNKLVQQYIFDTYRKKISPKLLIDYNRLPLLSKNGLYFRLTFDSDIRACISNDIFKNQYNWRTCIPEMISWR